MSVVVAVRVRPFNSRELSLNSKLCVDMDGATRTTLLDPVDPKKNKDFFFDYSFWSHDGFELQEDGMAVPVSSQYADQRKVYEDVGKQILDNAWLGYHCCLFAYGQTGAGKSYSMIGYGANIGIVPIACQEIFLRIEANETPNIEYEVSCSMLEIYNEAVQDLLLPVGKRPIGGLKIRQNQSLGFYVDGISKHIVESYEQIEKIMEQGTQHRTVASTQMNSCSSRAHTIIIIQFKQIEERGDRKYEKLSVINLVDLAGSEKVSKTGAQGKNLKEATNINLSLTTLGKVIQALAEKEMGKNKGQVVPYRESCLTKILCNALGGNSKTLMICAVSPSNDNWEETLSTLRYADQAKKIKNKATVNESATDKLIRELSEENEKLKLFMQKFQEQFGININNTDMKSIENLDPSKFNIQEVKDKKEEMEANIHLLEDTTKTKEQRAEENKKLGEEEAKNSIDLNKPYLSNVHEDPQLHNKIQYSLIKEVTVLGSKHSEPKPDIIVGLTRHNVAQIVFENEKNLFIQPYSHEYDCNILVNGCPIKEKTEIFHLDRIIISTTSMFVLVFKDSKSKNEALTLENIDFDFVQEEMNAYLELENKQRIQEFEEKKHEKEIETQKQTEEQQKQWEEQKKVLQDQIKQLQTQTKKSEKINKFKDKNYFEHKLQKFLPKVLEVNLIAKELKRNVSLQAKVSQFYNNIGVEEDEEADQNSVTNKSTIQIHVDNRELGRILIWDQAKFNERYYMIKDQLEKYFENPNSVIDPSDDPFFDPPESHLIGMGFLKLLFLAYFMDSKIELSLVGENGQTGILNLEMIPCDETGERNLALEMEEAGEDMIDDPQQLLGKEMYFKIKIGSATLPDNFCRDTYIEYAILDQEGKPQMYRTEKVLGKNSRPNYNYEKVHHCEQITNEVLQYFQTKNLIFKVYGLEEVKGGSGPKQAHQIPVEEEIEYAHLKNQQKKQQNQSAPNSQISNQTQGSISSAPTQNADLSSRSNQGQNRIETATQQRAQVQAQQADAGNQKKGKGSKNDKNKDDCNIF